MTRMRTGKLWMMGLLAVAVALVTVGAFQGETASAAMWDVDRVEPAPHEADGRVANSVEQIRLVKIWSAALTVGEASDGDTTYKGYASNMSPVLGSLEVKFLDRGAEYTIETLVHQQVGSFNQLELEANVRLPDDLVLKIGDRYFLLRDSKTLGLDGDMYTWSLDSGLGWEEGDTMRVKLLRIETYSICEGEQQAGAHAGG